MKKVVSAVVLAFLLFGAVSVSWGKGGGAKGNSATWESATWENNSKQ